MADRVFSHFLFSHEKNWHALTCMYIEIIWQVATVSHIDKPQCGHPKRAKLRDVNINTGAQSINTERTF